MRARRRRRRLAGRLEIFGGRRRRRRASRRVRGGPSRRERVRTEAAPGRGGGRCHSSRGRGCAATVGVTRSPSILGALPALLLVRANPSPASAPGRPGGSWQLFHRSLSLLWLIELRRPPPGVPAASLRDVVPPRTVCHALQTFRMFFFLWGNPPSSLAWNWWWLWRESGSSPRNCRVDEEEEGQKGIHAGGKDERIYIQC